MDGLKFSYSCILFGVLKDKTGIKSRSLSKMEAFAQRNKTSKHIGLEKFSKT